MIITQCVITSTYSLDSMRNSIEASKSKKLILSTLRSNIYYRRLTLCSILLNNCLYFQLVEKHTEAVQEIMAYIKQWPDKEIGSFKIGSLLPILNHFHGDVYLNGK